MFVGDGYYGSEAFRVLSADIECDTLVRFAKNRVLYREPLSDTGPRKRGHPTWRGAPFKLHDPTTHHTPDESYDGDDDGCHRLEVACWHDLHFRGARQDTVCAIRVIRYRVAKQELMWEQPRLRTPEQFSC